MCVWVSTRRKNRTARDVGEITPQPQPATWSRFYELTATILTSDFTTHMWVL